MVLAQGRHVDGCDKTEGPEINLHVYGQLGFDKDPRTSVKKEHLGQMVLGQLDIRVQKGEFILLPQDTKK